MDDEPLDIPTGTAVDPALFPEVEYPIECLGCGYALRGLPDGRCPECGREFKRGELLVSIYYHFESRRVRQFHRLGAAFYLVALALLLLLAPAGILGLVLLAVDPNHDLRLGSWGPYWLGALAISIAGLCITDIAVRLQAPPKKKRSAMAACLTQATTARNADD